MKMKILLTAAIIIMTAFPAIAKSRYGSTWETTISISYGNDTAFLTLGADKTATDSFENKWETRALLSGYIQAYFSHPEWGMETSYFWSDIKDLQLPKEWVFYVYSTLSNADLEMRWDSYFNVPDTVELYLIDETDGTTIDMKSQSTYNYTNISASPKTFRIKAAGYVEGLPANGDTIPPDTLISSGITEFTGASVAVTYTGSDNVTPVELLQFAYKLDNGTWSSWSNSTSVVLSGLSDGVHTFYVKSRDEAGNEDHIPSEASFTVDTLQPVLMVNQPNPSILWPANGKLVDIIISGTATDNGSGLTTVSYLVNDEYGEFNLAGNITPENNGNFSFVISLRADRDNKDIDGRLYVISVGAKDRAGNLTNQDVFVTVPYRK